jgi:hypothetical protein
MKFLISFAVVLVLILAYFRLFPSAPINPVLPVEQGQKEVNGHNADVPKGATEDEEGEEGEGQGSTSIAPATPGQTYGAAINPSGALPMTALATALGTRDSAKVTLTGKASAVCQAKGCWMTLPTADGKEMRVRFRDYAFFVPKDLSGHDVVVSGWAYRSTVPKGELQHYAKDAGKSEQEIAAIIEDEQQLTFMADGVRVVN